MKLGILAAVALVAVVSNPVLAQDAPLVELTNPQASIAALGLTVELVKGQDVFDTDNNLVGKVQRVLGDDADTPKVLEVQTADGPVELPLSGMELVNYRIITSLSDDEVVGVPPLSQ
jgi:hypothetical protein